MITVEYYCVYECDDETLGNYIVIGNNSEIFNNKNGNYCQAEYFIDKFEADTKCQMLNGIAMEEEDLAKFIDDMSEDELALAFNCENLFE